jgi:hypothetical protein
VYFVSGLVSGLARGKKSQNPPYALGVFDVRMVELTIKRWCRISQYCSIRSQSTTSPAGGSGTLTHVSKYSAQFYYQRSQYSGTSSMEGARRQHASQFGFFAKPQSKTKSCAKNDRKLTINGTMMMMKWRAFNFCKLKITHHDNQECRRCFEIQSRLLVAEICHADLCRWSSDKRYVLWSYFMCTNLGR